MSAADRRRTILDGIAHAAKLARRDPADIQLIAVSKGRGAGKIEDVIETGQRDFGENRVQEVLEKWPALRDRYPHVRLHGIGRLQSDEAVEAVRLFDVDSLARPREPCSMRWPKKRRRRNAFPPSTSR